VASGAGQERLADSVAIEVEAGEDRIKRRSAEKL
jgi:hypothetical protein